MVRHRARLPPPPPTPAGLSQELTLAAPTGFSFATRNITPPSAQYLERDDNLIINFWSSINPTSFEVRGRLLTADQGIKDIRRVVSVASGSVRQQQIDFSAMAPGFLLDLQCFPSPGIFTTRGQCFVSIGLGKGPAASPYGNRILIQGYLENGSVLQYPGSAIQGFLDGRGNLRAIIGTTPPVASFSTETVPTGARWRLQAYRLVLFTDATPGTRIPDFILQTAGGANPWGQLNTQPGGGVGPSAQVAFIVANVGGLWVANGEEIYPISGELFLKAGDQIVFNWGGVVGPADQITAPFYYVEEWLQP